MINTGDVIELIVDIPERNLRAGFQGTVVHCHDHKAHEVEFTNEKGETLDFLSLNPKQFIVIWRVDTEQWVSVAERIAALTIYLPEESAQEVLDFARFLSMHKNTFDQKYLESINSKEILVYKRQLMNILI